MKFSKLKIPAAALKYTAAAVCLGLIVGFSIFTATRYRDAGLFTPRGDIIVKVVDGQTEQPLEGAKVVIPELGKTFLTDAQGLTESISVPIIEDGRFNKLLKKPWGEVTILVYLEEYTPYALFYAQVWENQARSGPVVYMFGEDGSDPFSIIEGPQRLWVNEMVDKYRPQ